MKHLFIIISLLAVGFAEAQTDKTRLTGKVTEAGANEPVIAATVQVSPVELFTQTGSDGVFTFDRIPVGKVNIRIQYIGMETIDTTVTIVANRTNTFDFVMKESTFHLEEVTVTATMSKAGQSTASFIARQAMDHVQATSLRDVLQLLPGVSLGNPDMSSANRISIRGGSALGSAILIDGMQLSDNANLQSLGASSTSGVDIRSLSLDNIESVEVIRGIPSVEYGDLTAGAVIIKSRSGKDPLRVKFKTNPDLYQGSLSKGFAVGRNSGFLNLSADYLYSVNNPTQAYAYYQRTDLKAIYSKSILHNLYTQTSLGLNFGKDTRKLNPDDQRTQTRSASGSTGVTFNTNGILTINKGWWTSLDYIIAGAYTDKHSWQEELLGSAASIYSTSRTDGAIIANHPGEKVYDDKGNELTHVPAGAENDWTTYLPNEYKSYWDVFGKEINFNVKVKTTFDRQWNSMNNKIVVGAEYKTDGNRGKGQVYDERYPPMRSGSFLAHRPRPYSDIPFLNQFGAFAEDRLIYTAGERKFIITAGGRFDALNGKTVLVPRINASADLIPQILTLRGGWGVTAKMPTTAYLYPDNAYYDFRYYADISDPENIRSLVLTRVFETENKDLEIATNRKVEIGFDLKINNKYLLAVTAYDELAKNGFSTGYDLYNSWHLIEYPEYQPASKTAGQYPTLELTNKSNVLVPVTMPNNNGYFNQQGLEYILDLGRFDAIRTSFYIDGAYLKSTSYSNGYSYRSRSNRNQNVGVFEPGRTKSYSERFLTTVRATHNIPKIGFVLTLTSQAVWFQKSWTRYSTDSFTKYISYKDGKVYDYDPATMDSDPEFSYLIDPIDPNRELAEKTIPTLLFNFNLSKELGDFLTASFFANNMFYSRPIYESTRTPGSFVELGHQLFFGFDLKMKIK